MEAPSADILRSRMYESCSTPACTHVRRSTPTVTHVTAQSDVLAAVSRREENAVLHPFCLTILDHRHRFEDDQAFLEQSVTENEQKRFTTDFRV